MQFERGSLYIRISIFLTFSLFIHMSLFLFSTVLALFIHHSLLFLSGWSGACECCRLKQVSQSSAAALELKHTERPNTSFSKEPALFPSSFSTTHQTINTGVPSLLAWDWYLGSGLCEFVFGSIPFLWQADVLGMD